MKRMVLLLAALCFAIFGMTGSCLAESENESSEENLVYDSGIRAGLFSTQPLGVYAETVRFTPPSSPWTLTKVQIAGWNGYDNKTLPTERLIYLEIRDEDLNLLYQFTDSQIPYFTYPTPTLAQIQVPPITVDGDFYVCFYDRGALGVAYNSTEIDDGRSYIYNRHTGELSPATGQRKGSEEFGPLNWIIRAVGH